MSEEEQKIWEELETEIERDLEEEIKDGIRQLALQLHRLYQHKKVRTCSSASRSFVSLQPGMNTKVNITITMEGECKIAVCESNSGCPNAARPHSSRSKPSSSVTNRVLMNKEHTTADARGRHLGKEAKKQNYASNTHRKFLVWKY